MRLPARTIWSTRVSTNRRRPTYVDLGLNGEYKEENNGVSATVAPTLTMRPSSRASLSLAPTAGWVREPGQYIRTSSVSGAPHYIMGHLQQRTAALTLRGTWLFTPDLSFDLYAQPFLSAGQYSGIKEVVASRAARFSDRFHVYTANEITFDAATQRYSVDLQSDGVTDFSFDNPAFSVRELNTNAVLRWEYRPGSMLFLVWSHARDDDLLDPGLRLRRDLDRLLATKPTNVFLVKMSYWMSR
jgi:hypothetical protein